MTDLLDGPDRIARHHGLLKRAMNAVFTRDYWSTYAETPGAAAYGELGERQGGEAFRNHLGRTFILEDNPGDGLMQSVETSS